MGDVDSAAQVALGEGVVTAGIELASGIRSPYPKGLIVGQVVDVAHDPNEVVQTVFLAPAVDLEHLEYVLVITNYLGGIGGDEPSSAPCPSTTSGTIPNSDIPCSSPGGTIAP
jgi:cell shape-determining protein MreC